MHYIKPALVKDRGPKKRPELLGEVCLISSTRVGLARRAASV